jgi:hypothetical protein
MTDRQAYLRAVPDRPVSRAVPLAKFLELRRELADTRAKLGGAAALATRRAAMVDAFLKPLHRDQRDQLKGAGGDNVATMSDIEFGVFLGRLEAVLEGDG